MTFAELENKVFNIDLDRMAEAAVIANENAIVDLNRQQMRVGQTSNGDAIRPDYANPLYADAKAAAGSQAPFGTPDLLLTGSFQQEMQMEVESSQYNIFSTDEKANKLTGKYGKQIWGLTDESKAKARQLTSRTLATLFKQATGLKG